MRRHPIDVVSLVAGLVVVLGVLGWALWWTDTVAAEDFSWLVPIGLVVAGATGIAASLRSPD
ncbi:MAG: hypothetical protein K0Q93_1514 [Nocardioidaceae bacterium]|jgi:hypothetical protein|nr:hypothetical protein [Nocardioidaceae bacterium]